MDRAATWCIGGCSPTSASTAAELEHLKALGEHGPLTNGQVTVATSIARYLTDGHGLDNIAEQQFIDDQHNQIIDTLGFFAGIGTGVLGDQAGSPVGGIAQQAADLILGSFRQDGSSLVLVQNDNDASVIRALIEQEMGARVYESGISTFTAADLDVSRFFGPDGLLRPLTALDAADIDQLRFLWETLPVALDATPLDGTWAVVDRAWESVGVR